MEPHTDLWVTPTRGCDPPTRWTARPRPARAGPGPLLAGSACVFATFRMANPVKTAQGAELLCRP